MMIKEDHDRVIIAMEFIADHIAISHKILGEVMEDVLEKELPPESMTKLLGVWYLLSGLYNDFMGSADDVRGRNKNEL